MKAIGRKQKFSCHYAEYVGNYLHVKLHTRIHMYRQSGDNVIYRYVIVNNAWESLPPFLDSDRLNNFICFINDYIYAIVNLNHFRGIVWLKTIDKVELIWVSLET